MMEGRLHYSSYRWLCTYRHVSNKNLYKILDIQPNASSAEIKAAFYKLSKKYHPDVARNLGNSQTQTTLYLEIRNAYDVLKDKKKRREYDLGFLDATNFYTTGGERQKRADQHAQNQNFSADFYTRTSQHDDEEWYKWYRKRREEQMEARRNVKTDENIWAKHLLAFIMAFFVLSTIARIYAEHSRRKVLIEHVIRYNAKRKDRNDRENFEKYLALVLKTQDENEESSYDQKEVFAEATPT